MEPEFAPHPDRTGLQIADPIENARFALFTPDAVEPSQTATEEFYFPVDSAVSVRTPEIEIPKLANVFVRTRDGDLVADNADHFDRSFESGSYVLELTTAPMKLYLAVESGFDLRHAETAVTIAFDAETEVRIGARSFHDKPAATITTTPDPEGAMKAISYLGSALKTTSPERSFPTLRGHPPLIEVGEEFSVPDGLERPETGVRIEVPAAYEYVYPASSLAYYLGAEVVPGEEPRLLAGDDFTYLLDGPLGYEQTIGRVLKQTFFFDCLTRTEGYYEVELHERHAVESLVDLDFAALYDVPLAERLEAYLSVPFETIEEHVPDWNLTTDVVPTAENAEVLPFVASDLALVRCPSGLTAGEVSPTPEPIDEFFRSAEDESSRSPDDEEFTRSVAEGSETATPSEDVFNPNPAETVEHAWVGDGIPIGANKTSVESYRRRVERTVPEKSNIEIHVVCNDERMKAEGIVEEFYGMRELLKFDVCIHYDLTTAALADLLATEADFLHYIGHAEAAGLRCPDGHLDVRTVEDVNVKAFLLNACSSYEQGQALVEAGSYGGVVTLSEVANSVATETGQTLGRLLNCGFSLRSALSIVKDDVAAAYQYVAVGDGGLTLCQSESGTPLYAELTRLSAERFRMTLKSYPTRKFRLGATNSVNVSDSASCYLSSGVLDTFKLTREDLKSFLGLELIPVETEEGLYWSDQLPVSAI
ncbi:hypothetical protein [Halorussus halophilus]|uniref:hypothetical protein n=1 Tax=Halorussus halophilus TaxID=2650975 RepID=UPI001301779B|nr:hypothetical protein [Halorussus halophilus]